MHSKNKIACNDVIVMYSQYYRQLYADITMKNFNIETIYVSHEGPKAHVYKTFINSMLFKFNIRGKLSVIRVYT